MQEYTTDVALLPTRGSDWGTEVNGVLCMNLLGLLIML